MQGGVFGQPTLYYVYTTATTGRLPEGPSLASCLEESGTANII